MSDPISRLKSLQVSDVMTPNVVELYAGESMTQAGAVFNKHGITSAPVIDEKNRCIGMLSAADFLLAKPPSGNPTQIGNTAQNKVSRYMTSTVKSIASDMPMLKAAHIMNAEHIHRLPVLDTEDRVVGLVSTMDIVASLLNLIDENAS